MSLLSILIVHVTVSHDAALKALILNNNDISSITGLSCLKQLNALGNHSIKYVVADVYWSIVLSHNQLEMISLDDLSLLTKLSLSHNLLTTCPDTRVIIPSRCY